MADPSAEFLALLDRDPIKPAEVAAFLDGLSHEERVRAIRSAGRAPQRRLYAAVAGHGSVRLADLVPPGRRSLETVRHFGKNTLPAFTHFEKRFCRPEGQDAGAPRELWGFNFQSLQPLTGPGYYVAYEDAPHGEALVDYTRVPPSAPPGWPAVRGNERGLSRFVYGFMVDRLRRVSEHVTIGSAARHGREFGSWFLLCREP
jgi:hypothetical protein